MTNLPVTRYPLPVTRYPLPVTSLLFAFLIFFAACKTEENPLPENELFTNKLALLKQEAMEKANAAWKERLQNDERLQSKFLGRSPVGCDCGYLIEDVQVTTPPAHPNFAVTLASNAACGPVPEDCNIFYGTYATPPVSGCNPTILPGCVDFWPYLPPEGGQYFGYPLRCDVLENSTFPVGFNAFWIQSDCNDAGHTPASITFRIVCNSTCGGKVTSNPRTLTYDEFGNGDNMALVNMGECCDPGIDE